MRTLLLLSAIAIPVQSQAQATISASFGQANSAKCSETISVVGPNTILSCGNERSSGILRAGYAWNSGFGLELAYFRLGSAEADTVNGADQAFVDATYGLGSYAYSHEVLKTRVQVISLVQSFELTSSIHAAVKLGLGRAKSELTSCAVLRLANADGPCAQTTSQPRTSHYLGGSLSYRATSSASAVFSVDYVPLAGTDGLYPGTLGASSRKRVLVPSIGVQMQFW